MQELGLFCGTFNPIHLGHLRIAEYAREQLALSSVIFVCSGEPPHGKHELLDKEIRQRLVEAAIAGHPYFQSSRVELDRQGPSYTADTLKYFKQQHGSQTRLNFIIGEDSLETLHEWHDFKTIIQLCRMVVAPRTLAHGQDEVEPLDNFKKTFNERLGVSLNMVVLSCPKTELSSSEIRKRLKEKSSVTSMVPAGVEQILLAGMHYQ